MYSKRTNNKYTLKKMSAGGINLRLLPLIQTSTVIKCIIIAYDIYVYHLSALSFQWCCFSIFASMCCLITTPVEHNNPTLFSLVICES